MRQRCFIDFNESACRQLGYTREELLNRGSSDVRVDRPSEVLQRESAEPGRERRALRRQRPPSTGARTAAPFRSRFAAPSIDTPEGPILVVNARDLTERMAADEREAAHLRYQASLARFGQAALDKREPQELIEEALADGGRGGGRGRGGLRRARTAVGRAGAASRRRRHGRRPRADGVRRGQRCGNGALPAASLSSAPAARCLSPGRRNSAARPWLRCAATTRCAARFARCRAARMPTGRRSSASCAPRRPCFPPACSASIPSAGSPFLPSSTRSPGSPTARCSPTASRS